jgi:hypothetical protein
MTAHGVWPGEAEEQASLAARSDRRTQHVQCGRVGDWLAVHAIVGQSKHKRSGLDPSARNARGDSRGQSWVGSEPRSNKEASKQKGGCTLGWLCPQKGGTAYACLHYVLSKSRDKGDTWGGNTQVLYILSTTFFALVKMELFHLVRKKLLCPSAVILFV